MAVDRATDRMMFHGGVKFLMSTLRWMFAPPHEYRTIPLTYLEQYPQAARHLAIAPLGLTQRFTIVGATCRTCSHLARWDQLGPDPVNDNRCARCRRRGPRRYIRHHRRFRK